MSPASAARGHAVLFAAGNDSNTPVKHAYYRERRGKAQINRVKS